MVRKAKVEVREDGGKLRADSGEVSEGEKIR